MHYALQMAWFFCIKAAASRVAMRMQGAPGTGSKNRRNIRITLKKLEK